MTVRTGDRAILIGVCAIGIYERWVRDDEDLISRRVAAYRRHALGRLLADAVVLVTALHLTESVKPEWDVYHLAMARWRRSAAPASPHPNDQRH